MKSVASSDTHLFPVFDRVLPRAEKETRLQQRGLAVWFYGLSGSGKSTLAIALERRLFTEGITTHLLDGDNVRTGLNRGLGFSDEDRMENLRRVAEVAKLFVQAGLVVLCSFITPRRENRDLVRGIIGPDDFFEAYVKASFDTCARRDPKGLYAKAAAGAVGQFTGRDSTFEPPPTNETYTSGLVLDTETFTPDACLSQLHNAIIQRIKNFSISSATTT